MKIPFFMLSALLAVTACVTPDNSNSYFSSESHWGTFTHTDSIDGTKSDLASINFREKDYDLHSVSNFQFWCNNGSQFFVSVGSHGYWQRDRGKVEVRIGEQVRSYRAIYFGDSAELNSSDSKQLYRLALSNPGNQFAIRAYDFNNESFTVTGTIPTNPQNLLKVGDICGI